MENIILTNMTLLESEGKILVLDRLKNDWPGLTLPGGKVKKGEDIKDSAIREFYEETGLKLLNISFVDYIEWLIDGDRHLCLLFKSDAYKGEISHSDEGKVFFVKVEELDQSRYSCDFDLILAKYGLGGKKNV